mmetsp:Transcript_640/g.1080  ORF Transcript_640/g.1080 Transcript_640/m.1080 type:complete len:118 (-) Transcript_640:153-506(-)|eukprot:CAMPEP_0201532878 /NCGR_PEP_ID=MMETSP0161_2-20130828/51524_1 /ASSEMBLY_ACC=CAM_ASM_000251 /TAXON_ID=180227 /ORGANISM="Neoparamoeba aestuarina, Strain SoJaBio B1-5/56/2" /LENGTH=117 /DNA_ID=CAMNT_0047936535 /DNA_START=71 /DNA_END=424 /DNA_ORIENTATION=-
MSIGVPVKLIHEAENHVVTIELKSGELYRGTLHEAEDNMNCHLTNKGTELIHTDRTGKETRLEHVFIRGSQIRFLILPDMLKNAPMFNRELAKKSALRTMNSARGRGRGMMGRGGGR